ncbi:MAG: hypothetical protein DRQ13_03320 [Ignavibacteriae bacterium]|nr:MAG: hypothetical protein DRQ13_03320 [Ignavibacteriota bacterium]
MIRIITSILILLLCSISIAQTNYIALITDPQIGPDANAEKLIEVVDDINKRDSISYVVVMGNITANGKFDEFLSAQEILDGLTIPYFVVGGEKDYLLSEGKGNEISLLWGDDKFFHTVNDMLVAGFNSYHPFYSKHGYLDIETRNWLNNLLESDLRQNVLICSYFSPEDIKNKPDALFMNAEDRHIYFANSEELNAWPYDPRVELTSLSSINSQEYHLIKSKRDTIYVFKFEMSDSSLSLLFNYKKKSPHYDEELFVVPYPKSPLIKWNTKLHSTTISSINNSKEIFIASKKGKITCLDNKRDKIWTYETNGTIYSPPKVEKDLVVVATNEGDLFTINKNTGNLFQVIGIGETITSDIELIDIEFNGMQTKGICFGTVEGNFYCYELYSLELIWWNNGVKEMINSSVATVKGKIIFQDKKGTLYCLSSDNGVLLWKWKAKTKIFDPLFKSDLIISNNNVYFIDFDGDLHCIDALLGTKKWSIRKIKATGKIELNEKKNEIVLHSAKNKILVVSPAKREVTEELILPGETKNEFVTSIELISSKLIVGFTNGNVYQLMKKQVPKNIFWQSSAPIVSLNKINGNILVTDYDGNLTLLDLLEKKK